MTRCLNVQIFRWSALRSTSPTHSSSSSSHSTVDEVKAERTSPRSGARRPLRIRRPPGRTRACRRPAVARSSAPVRLAATTSKSDQSAPVRASGFLISPTSKRTVSPRAMPGLSRRLARADSTASGSTSIPRPSDAPSTRAAIARTPDPVPTSRTRLPDRSISCSARRHSLVVAWCPVPKPIEGSMITRAGRAEAGATGWRATAARSSAGRRSPA